MCGQSAPYNLPFSLKDVFKNLPGWAVALVAGTPHGQLRTTYAALGPWKLRRPRVRSLRSSTRLLQSATPVFLVFLVLFVCLCLFLASLPSPSTWSVCELLVFQIQLSVRVPIFLQIWHSLTQTFFSHESHSVPLASFGDLVSPRPQVVV